MTNLTNVGKKTKDKNKEISIFNSTILLTYGIMTAVIIGVILFGNSCNINFIVESVINGIAPTTITFVGTLILRKLVANDVYIEKEDVDKKYATYVLTLTIVYVILYIVFVGIVNSIVKYIIAAFLFAITLFLIHISRKIDEQLTNKKKESQISISG